MGGLMLQAWGNYKLLAQLTDIHRIAAIRIQNILAYEIRAIRVRQDYLQ